MTYKKKLIEVAIPLGKINEESAREKSIRHGHPSTLHLWWARRPLAAARAVLFAQLVDDPSAHPDKFPTEEARDAERQRLFDIMRRLVPWENSNDPTVLAEAHAEILKSCDGELPKILDPFGGGGAIPLESLRLGLPTFSGDLNPVAVTIQRAMLEIPQRFAGRAPVNPEAESKAVWERAEGLAADVEYYGQWMQSEARKRIGKYYPDAVLEDGSTATPIAWIWARTVKSPDPSWPGHVPLVRSWELSKKPGKPTTWIEPTVDAKSKTISYSIRTGGKPLEGTVGRQGGTCLATGSSIPFSYIREESREGHVGFALLAIVAEGQRGRAYLPADLADWTIPIVDENPIPGTIFDWPGRMNVVRYGLEEWRDLFSPRQLIALTTFSDLLADVREQILADATALESDGVRLRDGGTGRDAYADALLTYLAFTVDKCADFWSSICSWNNGAEKMRQTFGRQAIPMTWDFAEANPFSSSTGNWNAMISWVSKSVAHLPARSGASTAQRDARARISELGRCVIATDPPYYDNISYADLSDFFYVWMRRNLKEVWPDEMSTLLTPKVEELIANRYRAGSKEAAHAHFELGMQGVFQKAAENADERFPSTVFYAFKATEGSEDGQVSTGWETFLSGLIEAGYSVTATWPIRTEKPGKIGMAAGDNMLASSIVLACRKRRDDAPLATRGEFLAQLRRELPEAVRLLQAENIAPVDMAQSAIGPGMKVFSQFSKVVEMGGGAMSVRIALILINEVLSEILNGEESELDSDTRFALTWFEQFGHNPGPFGDADVLARAKDTTVNGVCASGIAASRDGRVWLVERKDLPSDWNPATDARLTVWEITQHSIRALESSEAEAAAILRKVGGGFSDRAKQLAYLLYGICEKKGWAQEAGPYDMLIRVWPDLLKRAASDDLPPPDDKDTGQGQFDFGDDE
jgi:putative DNA methylase